MKTKFVENSLIDVWVIQSMEVNALYLLRWIGWSFLVCTYVGCVCLGSVLLFTLVIYHLVLFANHCVSITYNSTPTTHPLSPSLHPQFFSSLPSPLPPPPPPSFSMLTLSLHFLFLLPSFSLSQRFYSVYMTKGYCYLSMNVASFTCLGNRHGSL